MASTTAFAFPVRPRSARRPPAPAWRSRPTRPLITDDIVELVEQPGVHTLTRRRMPHHRGTIDLIVAASSGIMVVEGLALRAAPRIVPAAGGFGAPRARRLMAGGQDHTAATRSVERQVTAIRRALASDGGKVPQLRSALCVPATIGLSLFAPLRLNHVDIDGPEAIAELATRRGPLLRDEVRRLAQRLDRAFPRA